MSNPSIMRPGPDRDRTIAGLVDEYRSFAELIGALNASDWTRQTRCTGWQVRDVAGHVVGQALDTVSGVIGMLRDAAAAAEPAVAQLLALPADHFSEQTGIAVHDFILATTGRSDPARLGLPDILNIYR